MKTKPLFFTRVTPVTLVAASALFSTMAFSQDESLVLNESSFTKFHDKFDFQTHTSDSNARSDVDIDKSLYVDKFVEYKGHVKIDGTIDVDGAAFATINNKQDSYLNHTENTSISNNSTVSENVLSNASGDIGVNVSSGDNNQQDNATAIAAQTVATGLLFSADAEIFSYQNNEYNNTLYDDTYNGAYLGENALAAASGNIGVNIASGHNLQQKNNLALAFVYQGSMAESNVSAEQYSDHNSTVNLYTENSAEISGGVLVGATGHIGVNVSAGTGNQQANHLSVTSN